ncbi:MAG: protein arginine kinase [candidate division WOR-3 bacterium]
MIAKWLDSSGAQSDVVISNRLRLARNLKGFPFAIKTTKSDQERIITLVNYALEDLNRLKTGRFLTQHELTPLVIQSLLERHLISPDFAVCKQQRAVFINNDETESLMINEEDHIRYQVLASGLDFKTSLARINDFDDQMAKEVEFAYSEELGFLTACPSNVGTGLRASVLVHLPGLVLTKEIEKVLRGILQIGLAVRGLYGEGTETKGNFFQVSNQQSLGRSETEIVEVIEKAVRQIINYERKARDYLYRNARIEIEDKIYRAQAILQNARIITSEEAINLLAVLRFGVTLGVISDISLKTINELLILTKPASLQLYYHKEMAPEERDEKRATLLRTRLGRKVDKSE